MCGGEQPWKGEVLPQGMCTHTHITRSDYLEGLVARQNWVGVLPYSMFCRDQETRKRIGKSKDGSLDQ